jgi:general L-amino acid transport system permease protein
MVRRPSRRAYVGQWVLLLVVVAVGGLLIWNLLQNFALRNLSFGFAFLAKPANFDIPFRLLTWSTLDTYAKALLVSLLNTLLVSALGIVAATLLGLLVGIMRLSVNWLARSLALGFIEFVRNTPQLVQIIFWYFAVLQTLPAPRQSLMLPGGMLLNIRGFYLPDLVPGVHAGVMAWVAAALLLATPFVWRLQLAGRRIGWMALLLPLAAVGLLAASVARIEVPVLKGFNITGGTQVPPELVALWAGLTMYSSAFIAEIVRSAIEAVPKGQHEAGRSLGLHPGPLLFLIVLPQALRIMVPQLTSQYLNLIKSSTLGAAVAYPEIFQIFAGTVMNQTGKEVETVIVVMAVFLTINLIFSAFMNWYNRRLGRFQHR